MYWWDDEEMAEEERQAYLRAFPEGEDILCAATLWLDYLGDGKRHKGLRNRSIKFARHLLHIIVTKNRPGGNGAYFRLCKLWKERIREFGLRWHPETNELEVIDKHRWMHACSILRQSGQLPYITFLNRLYSGCHYDDWLDPALLPPRYKDRRRQVVSCEPEPYYKLPSRTDWRERGVPEPEHYFDPPLAPKETSVYNPVKSFIRALTEEM